MWDVKLVDIAGDGLVTEITYMVGTLATIEILVEGLINCQLGVHTTRLVYNDELVYDVWVDGIQCGLVAIKNVNAVPIKRK